MIARSIFKKQPDWEGEECFKENPSESVYVPFLRKKRKCTSAGRRQPKAFAMGLPGKFSDIFKCRIMYIMYNIVILLNRQDIYASISMRSVAEFGLKGRKRSDNIENSHFPGGGISISVK